MATPPSKGRRRVPLLWIAGLAMAIGVVVDSTAVIASGADVLAQQQQQQQQWEEEKGVVENDNAPSPQRRGQWVQTFADGRPNAARGGHVVEATSEGRRVERNGGVGDDVQQRSEAARRSLSDAMPQTTTHILGSRHDREGVHGITIGPRQNERYRRDNKLPAVPQPAVHVGTSHQAPQHLSKLPEEVLQQQLLQQQLLQPQPPPPKSRAKKRRVKAAIIATLVLLVPLTLVGLAWLARGKDGHVEREVSSPDGGLSQRPPSYGSVFGPLSATGPNVEEAPPTYTWQPRPGEFTAEVGGNN